jgi:hypothetical protein
MEVSSAASSLNWLAVIVAAVAGFIIGGLWYGPLFGQAWMSASGVTKESARSRNMAFTFGLTYVLNVVAALSLAMFIGPKADWSFGLIAGVLTGTTFVSTALGVIYLFERRSLKLWLINGGFQTVNFGAMGAILGAWH